MAVGGIRLNMAVGGIRPNKGEIAVVKYGCRME
jgi:hypothetical protein